MESTKSMCYDAFTKTHARAVELMRRALIIDENSKEASKKREAMSLYQQSIQELEYAINIQYKQITVKKERESAKRLVQKMTKTMTDARGRLNDLEKETNSHVIIPMKIVKQVNTPMRLPRRITSQQPSTSNGKRSASVPRKNSSDTPTSHLLKGVDPKFGQAIIDEMFDRTSNIRFADVIDLAHAKQALEEAVILPALNPALFSGLTEPVQGILLFGPPGNGKTLLAKAVATESQSNFFNISAAALTSKWVGDSEKMVKALFQVARNAQPCIIFIDEIDSILCERNDKENEASRRMKTEFLIQFDGISSNREDRMLVIGATNRPYDLDDAVIRRFPKRILIDLPTESARYQLIKSLLDKHVVTDISSEEIRSFARRTAGYSNSDLLTLAREAAMGPIRELDKKQVIKAKPSQMRPVNAADFDMALTRVKPSSNDKIMDKLREFAARCGQLA